MVQPHNRHSSMSLYLASTAIVDTVILSIGKYFTDDNKMSPEVQNRQFQTLKRRKVHCQFVILILLVILIARNGNFDIKRISLLEKKVTSSGARLACACKSETFRS